MLGHKQKLLGHVPGCAGAWLRHCRAGIHKQNNLHSVKPRELDETCALSLFPNKSWLSPQQIAELVYHIHVALLRQGKGVQQGNLIILWVLCLVLAYHQVDQNKALVYFLYGHCKNSHFFFCMYLNSSTHRILEILKKKKSLALFPCSIQWHEQSMES